jgi:hypothetical protein
MLLPLIRENKNEMLLMKLYAVAADKLQKIVVPEFRLQI